MDKPTPGWQTTEFWLTVAHQIVSIIILLKVLSPGDANTLDATLAQVIPAVFLLVGQMVVLYKYIHHRQEVKTQPGTDPAPEPPAPVAPVQPPTVVIQPITPVVPPAPPADPLARLVREGGRLPV